MILRSVIERPTWISYEPFTNDHEPVASSQISKARRGSSTVASALAPGAAPTLAKPASRRARAGGVVGAGRYAGVRDGMAGVLRAEYGDRLPSGLTPERAAPLLVAVLDGLQYQWLLDPESVDMAAAFRDFLTLLGEGEG